jgi:transcriptional regulator with XRE-family HTH domain
VKNVENHIGEIILRYRTQNNLTLSELEEKSGVSKSSISRIENGETKRPELITLLRIFEALDVQYEEIIELYISNETRNSSLHDLLLEAIQLSNEDLIIKIVSRILENPKEKTEDSVEILYNTALNVENTEIKLVLFNQLAQYCRIRGIQPYMSKALFHRYRIERNNPHRLEETFRHGEEVLYYIEFLSHEERINLCYLMAFDAHDLKKYEQCIELGKMGHAEDSTSNEIKERIALAICNSYMRMGKFEDMESHIEMYEKLGYRFIMERSKYLRAIILSKTGHYQEAIPLLRECVGEATKNNLIHRVNDLIEALLYVNDVNSIEQVITTEEHNFSFDFNNAYNFSGIGNYYKNKGAFLVSRGHFNEGMDAYLQSIVYYGKINRIEEIMSCAVEINMQHCELKKDMDLELLKKLNEVYNMIKFGKRNEG